MINEPFLNKTGRAGNNISIRNPSVSFDDLKDGGKIRIWVHRDAAASDEAIVAIIAHEIFEVQRLRSFMRESGGSISTIRFIQETQPNGFGPGISNAHSEAWDYADRIVRAMRGKK